MYCIKCGVQLGDTERKCPLCDTVVFHPEMTQPTAQPLYPGNKMPKAGSGRRGLSGVIIFLFLIPLFISLYADLQWDGRLEWFGYVAGGLAVSYIVLALPMWFQKPNPVIFAPCDFAAVALYLMYIDLATKGGWFVGFALPVTAVLALIVCAVVTLVRYIRRGRLYIFGGALMGLGAWLLLIEALLANTFAIAFIGWSVYPLAALCVLGGILIYLAINSYAREIIERKLFF